MLGLVGLEESTGVGQLQFKKEKRVIKTYQCIFFLFFLLGVYQTILLV